MAGSSRIADKPTAAQEGIMSPYTEFGVCDELVFMQGFQRYLICEVWTNGYKDMSKNAFLLNIAPPKGQRSPKLCGLFMMVS